MIRCETRPNGTFWADTDDKGDSRRLRWKRRARAKAIAYEMSPTQQSDDTGPLKRIKTCGIANKADVPIKVHQGRAFATNLRACGNVWTCPTCAARIEARRCAESQAAYDEHVASGGTFGMLTLTLKHKKSTPLAQSLDDLNHAWERLQQRRKFKPLYNMLSGSVVNVEITYGDNGWHPHLHIILLAGAETTHEQVKEQTDALRRNWSDLVNLRTDRYTIEHGLNLVWFGNDADTAARYTHKIAQEMNLSLNKSKGPTKNPLELLDRDDEEATALFIEYALATHGRQKNRWSNGLRRALNITKELTDEELAAANEDVGDEKLVISAKLWNSITYTEQLGWLEFVEAQHHFGGP